MELTINSDAEEGIEAILTNNAGADSEDINFTVSSGDVSHSVSCGETLIPETEETTVHSVCVASTLLPPSLVVSKSGSGATHTFVTAIRTSLQGDVDATGGVSAVSAAAETDYQTGVALASSGAGALAQPHTEAWAALWACGVELHGPRTDLGMAVNASIFAVLSSVRADWPYGLAPGGLTNYYNGHSFWDTETWMYPPMLLLFPDVARSLVQYRFDRLAGAELKASSYSPPYNGTMFPWESAYSGVETCPLFADTGIREQHINGDISFAIWQEFLMRGNQTWLRDIGYPILMGIADFWTSRVTAGSDGAVHIRDVIPPDEYADHVDDSVYTNYVAKLALEIAVQASEVLAVPCDTCAVYTAIADKMTLLFDPVLNIHPEYAGYDGREIKQADIVLLSYPLQMPMSDEVRRSDLAYYSDRTDAHGPAMTWGMHAIGYLDTGDLTSAAQFLDMSFQDNMHLPLHVWTETPDGNACNFITGAGGFLQTVTAGYPGLRLEGGRLSFAPRCIPGVTHIKLRRVTYLSTDLTFEYWCKENDYDGSVSPEYDPAPVRVSVHRADGASAALEGQLVVQSRIKMASSKEGVRIARSEIHPLNEQLADFLDQVVREAQNSGNLLTLEVFTT